MIKSTPTIPHHHKIMMNIRRRPSNFINSTTAKFDPQQKWQTKIGKLMVLSIYALNCLIFFSLYLYFDSQWKSMELKWDEKNHNQASCSTTMEVIDFIADSNAFYFGIILIFTLIFIGGYYFKDALFDSHVYVTVAIFATVTSLLSVITIALYTLGNGWNSQNCTESNMVDYLNRRLIFQSLASLFNNLIFMVISFHLHCKTRKLHSSIGDSSGIQPRKVYSISPPEFDIVSAFPPPPPYYASAQTC